MQINLHLLTTLLEYSRGSQYISSKYPIQKLRNYFLVKLQLSESLDEINNSLKGLKAAS